MKSEMEGQREKCGGMERTGGGGVAQPEIECAERANTYLFLLGFLDAIVLVMIYS